MARSLTARENFQGAVDAIDSSLLAPVAVAVLCAVLPLDAQLIEQAVQPPADGRDALQPCEQDQAARAERAQRGLLSGSFREHGFVELMFDGSMAEGQQGHLFLAPRLSTILTERVVDRFYDTDELFLAGVHYPLFVNVNGESGGLQTLGCSGMELASRLSSRDKTLA